MRSTSVGLRSSLGAALLLAALAAPAGALGFEHQRLSLDGAPATLFTIDVDRDGRRDLVVVLAATSWGQVGVEEPQRLDESGTYVQVMTVVPMLFDRRRLEVFLGEPGGSFATRPLVAELGDDVHAILPGPAAEPLLAWTDGGVSDAVVAPGGLVLKPRIAVPSPIAGSRALLPDLVLSLDLDGDGERDLLLPSEEGIEVHLGGNGGISEKAASVVPYELGERLPGDADHYRHGARRLLPLPIALDLDGDGLPELIFRETDCGWNRLRVSRNLGGGRFGPPVDPLAGRARDAEPEVVWIGDLDGVGRGEVVTQEEIEPAKDTMRAELAAARRPRNRYRIHDLGPDLAWNPEPRLTFELEGYIFGDETDAIGLPQGIGDIDGDGRVDMVGLSLDFSLLQAVRILAARSLRLGLDFQPYCQRSDGGFAAVIGQDLGGRFTLHLDRLRVGRLASFAGDFDGDGRGDFLQLGRGRSVQVRFGEPGCRFPEAGAASIRLAEEPLDLALTRVVDLDGDGRSDLVITTPPRKGAIDGRGTLDLYRSTGTR